MNTRTKIWSAAALLLASASASGVAYATTSGGEPAPSAYSSWKAQVKAQADCAQLDSGVPSKWEVCLVKSWDKSTKSQLTPVEYTANIGKGTFKVTWSHVTLPSGGKALKKADKLAKGIPATVYCKRYTGDLAVVLCNNGFRV